jgi:hypothetical protein
VAEVTQEPDEDKVPDYASGDVPKIPRAPLFGKPSVHGVVRAGMFATLLYAIIVMRKPCADGVGRFIGGFDDRPDAAPSGLTDHYPGYELMTAEEALKRWPDSPSHDAGAVTASDGAETKDVTTETKTKP